MKGIERRVVSLEDRRRAREGSFGHLDDAALNTAAMKLVDQIAQAGVALPHDWRDQYDDEPGKFMTWLGQQAGELAECAI